MRLIERKLESTFQILRCERQLREIASFLKNCSRSKAAGFSLFSTGVCDLVSRKTRCRKWVFLNRLTHIQQKCNRNCFGSQNVNLISAFVTLVLKFYGISQRKWIETMKRIHFLIEKYLIRFFFCLVIDVWHI